jgi:DNA polymerase I
MRSAQRVRVAFEEPSEYDADWYADQLIRACESVLSPIGWNDRDIRQQLREDEAVGLEVFR